MLSQEVLLLAALQAAAGPLTSSHIFTFLHSLYAQIAYLSLHTSICQNSALPLAFYITYPMQHGGVPKIGTYGILLHTTYFSWYFTTIILHNDNVLTDYLLGTSFQIPRGD